MNKIAKEIAVDVFENENEQLELIEHGQNGQIEYARTKDICFVKYEPVQAWVCVSEGLYKRAKL